MKHKRFETQTHSQQKEEIKRCCEEKREGSPYLYF